MKNRWDVEHWIHGAELVWILSWVALGLAVLVAVNTHFDLANGEVSLWQVVFKFLN